MAINFPNRINPTRIVPKILIPNEKFGLDEVLLEQYPKFDIYWYHWPYDGHYTIALEEDYEPVILIYDSQDRVQCIITRAHWDYQYYDSGFDYPFQILFDGSFHPPLVKTANNRKTFVKKSNSLIPAAYSSRKIKARDISEKFRTGKGHLTLLKKLISNPLVLFSGLTDPTIEALRAYDVYCV